MWVAVLTEEREYKDDLVVYSFKLHLIKPRSEGQGAVDWLKDVANVPEDFNALDTPTLRTALWMYWLAMSTLLHFPSMVSIIFDVPDNNTLVSFTRNVSSDRSWEDDAEGEEYVRLDYVYTVRTIAAIFPTQVSAKEALQAHGDTIATIIPPHDQHLGVISFSTGYKEVTILDSATEEAKA
jgi:hypothetical protein